MNILITGGASGLGATITKRLAGDNDHKVYFTFNLSQQAAKQIEGLHGNAIGLKCDYNNSKDLEQIEKSIIDYNIDILINNVWTSPISKNHFHKTPLEIYKNSFCSNILPTIQITQGAIKHFRKKKFGKIINILTSAIVNRPPIGWSEYVAGKAYMAELSKCWAIENGPFNITSNSISPSFMQTKMNADTDPRVIEEMTARHPLKKILSTDEVAETVSFFVNASQQINGTNFLINAAADVI